MIYAGGVIAYIKQLLMVVCMVIEGRELLSALSFFILCKKILSVFDKNTAKYSKRLKKLVFLS